MLYSQNSIKKKLENELSYWISEIFFTTSVFFQIYMFKCIKNIMSTITMN